MRNVRILLRVTLLIIIMVLLCSCEKGDSENEPNDEPENEIRTEMFEFGGSSFKMVLCPGGTFLTNEDDGDNDFEDGQEMTVEPFWISEVEVTNSLLAWIYHSAAGIDIGGGIGGGIPLFDTEDSSAPTYACDDYVKFGNQVLLLMGGSDLYGYYDIEFTDWFSVRSGLKEHPATGITWYGAVAACNWLSEKANRNEAYSGIHYEEWWANDTECNFSRQGFRLPTSAEWECAARWQGTDSSGDCYEYPSGSGQYWTKGRCASGSKVPANDVAATSQVAVYRYNDSSIENPDRNQPVRGNRTPNPLGLYDMSGNVWEWCFDEVESWKFRMIRGGSEGSYYPDIRISSTWYYSADGEGNDLGFRLVMGTGN
jgi:formylglycine-generating enzyme required for sulfatase activity